jgi:hypothetical protein
MGMSAKIHPTWSAEKINPDAAIRQRDVHGSQAASHDQHRFENHGLGKNGYGEANLHFLPPMLGLVNENQFLGQQKSANAWACQ